MAYLSQDEDERDFMSYAASMLQIIFPDLKKVITKFLSEKGIDIKPVKIPSESHHPSVEFDPDKDMRWTAVLVQGACLILVVFKTASEENYMPYMATRLKALKSKVGTQEDIESPFDLRGAQMVRTCLGASSDLKRAIINQVINSINSDGMMADVMAYVFSMLEYNEMNSFMFIYETILITKSSILKRPEIQHEVELLTDAMVKIGECDHPQFARYLLHSAYQTYLERSKFPILFAVACKLKELAHKVESIKQFVVPDIASSSLVTDLVKEHQEFLKSGKSNILKRHISFLTDHLEDAFEEDSTDDDSE
ncbi:unnamed protein product [Cuscuta europaea]|uniref:Uncharacterized protein n=1 Tax=Cuscuta europaea TaxID=41803 RepID=A0A9P1EA04_CUSEU|nr:unnamed protein product [Cuscuta europaea]